MKKWFAFLLALCLTLALIPCAAFAAGDGWAREGDGWKYYENGAALTGARWIEAEGARYLFGADGVLQTGDAEGDVLMNGNLYYINPAKNLNEPSTCYAVRNYTRSRGQETGITYYDADGITFVGWIKDAGGSLRYQTRIPKENIPGAEKDVYIYVWRAQSITETHPDPDAPNDRTRDIPAGRYLFDDNGVLLRSANGYVTEGVSYSTDANGRILDAPQTPETPPAPDSPAGGKTLVVYYSATGSTGAAARTIADETGGRFFCD